MSLAEALQKSVFRFKIPKQNSTETYELKCSNCNKKSVVDGRRGFVTCPHCGVIDTIIGSRAVTGVKPTVTKRYMTVRCLNCYELKGEIVGSKLVCSGCKMRMPLDKDDVLEGVCTCGKHIKLEGGRATCVGCKEEWVFPAWEDKIIRELSRHEIINPKLEYTWCKCGYNGAILTSEGVECSDCGKCYPLGCGDKVETD